MTCAASYLSTANCRMFLMENIGILWAWYTTQLTESVLFWFFSSSSRIPYLFWWRGCFRLIWNRANNFNDSIYSCCMSFFFCSACSSFLSSPHTANDKNFFISFCFPDCCCCSPPVNFTSDSTFYWSRLSFFVFFFVIGCFVYLELLLLFEFFSYMTLLEAVHRLLRFTTVFFPFWRTDSLRCSCSFSSFRIFFLQSSVVAVVLSVLNTTHPNRLSTD